MGNTGCTGPDSGSPCNPEPADNITGKYSPTPIPGQYTVGGQDLGLLDGGLPASFWNDKHHFDNKQPDDTDVTDPLIHEIGQNEQSRFAHFDADVVGGLHDVPQLPLPIARGPLDVEGSPLEPTKLGRSMETQSQAPTLSQRTSREKERVGSQAAESAADSAGSAAPACYFDFELGECPSHSSDVVSRCRKQYTFRSSARYDGEWLGSHRDGNGQQVWPDGAAYSGQWRRGRASGLGCLKHADGDVFIGEWVNGRAHGCGVYYFQDSMAVYYGQFRMDMRDGLGTEQWTDGSCYKGEFRAGMKHGAGEHTWPDGTSYEGLWAFNELAGAGRYTLSSGARYEGQWCGSVIHGIGTYMWDDGQRYEGHYDQDRKHGFGVLFGADGDSIAGYWKAGRYVGHRAGGT